MDLRFKLYSAHNWCGNKRWADKVSRTSNYQLLIYCPHCRRFRTMSMHSVTKYPLVKEMLTLKWRFEYLLGYRTFKVYGDKRKGRWSMVEVQIIWYWNLPSIESPGWISCCWCWGRWSSEAWGCWAASWSPSSPRPRPPAGSWSEVYLVNVLKQVLVATNPVQLQTKVREDFTITENTTTSI